jgi:hypothetical protein
LEEKNQGGVLEILKERHDRKREKRSFHLYIRNLKNAYQKKQFKQTMQKHVEKKL